MSKAKSIDPGIRLRCPNCGARSVDPTLKVLYCPLCDDAEGHSLPLCFEFAPRRGGRGLTNTVLRVIPASRFKWRSGCDMPVAKGRAA